MSMGQQASIGGPRGPQGSLPPATFRWKYAPLRRKVRAVRFPCFTARFLCLSSGALPSEAKYLPAPCCSTVGTPSCWRGHRTRIRVRRGDNHANNLTQNTLYDRIAAHRREGTVPGGPASPGAWPSGARGRRLASVPVALRSRRAVRPSNGLDADRMTRPGRRAVVCRCR